MALAQSKSMVLTIGTTLHLTKIKPMVPLVGLKLTQYGNTKHTKKGNNMEQNIEHTTGRYSSR